MKFPFDVENCEEQLFTKLFSSREFCEDKDLKDICEVNVVSGTRKFETLIYKPKEIGRISIQLKNHQEIVRYC